MRVVVTGASGHIGANLVRQLLAQGDQVRVLIHDCSLGLDGLDVERAAGSILEPAQLRAAFDGAEVVYHLAALISIVGALGGQVEQLNVTGARNVAEAALACGVRRLVHCSSVHAFEHRLAGAALDETSPRAGDGCPSYDQSKARGEAAVREVIARGLDAVVVNPSGVLGPHDYRMSRMGTLLWMSARGWLPVNVQGGFNWVDVRDVCDGMRAAAVRGRTGESYLLTGHWAPVAEVARRVTVLAGRWAPQLVLPMGLSVAFAPVALWGAQLVGLPALMTPEGMFALRHGSRHISHQKATQELGYAPRPLEETLQDTLQFYRDQGWA